MPEHDDMASEAELAAAHDPDVGAGSPDTAPHQAPSLTRLEEFPARTIALIVAVIDAGVITADALPPWLTALIAAIVTIAGALGIQAKVTPAARPRDEDGTPLVPAHDAPPVA